MIFLGYIVGAAVFILVAAVAWSIIRSRPSSLSVRFWRWISFAVEWRVEAPDHAAIERGPSGRSPSAQATRPGDAREAPPEA